MKGIPRGIPKHKGLNQTSKTEEREQKMKNFLKSMMGSEHLHKCSVCDPAKIFLTSKFRL
jgi:hypothetical protein